MPRKNIEKMLTFVIFVKSSFIQSRHDIYLFLLLNCQSYIFLTCFYLSSLRIFYNFKNFHTGIQITLAIFLDVVVSFFGKFQIVSLLLRAKYNFNVCSIAFCIF